jgi:hypothetical protein
MRDDAIANDVWRDIGMLFVWPAALLLSVIIAFAAFTSSTPTFNNSADEICLERTASERPSGFSEARVSGQWSWLPMGVECEWRLGDVVRVQRPDWPGTVGVVLPFVTAGLCVNAVRRRSRED